ncbi:DUF1176 domain-containing protein [Chelativorans composti]|jgi:Protein of unknown function (DUF1176).|uniref:DUF1176 domain-containing protein n=1 Tax=Chelativorans composti TaxID=768533 RepID=A0ABW5DJF1_9HYPH|nr:DUF1176 domain-containing protein [bacterium SGD-2]
MRPIQLLAAASLAVFAQAIPAVAQSQPPYLDDRSRPQQLIRSLYNAINRHEYGRAYSYFADPPAPSFDDYEKGFAGTQSVEVLTGVPFADAGAGTVRYHLPVAILAQNTNGEAHVFAGCYVLRLSSPTAQTTPYTPMVIESGRLRPANGDLAAVLPTRCSDDEPERTEDELLLQQAREAFRAIYGGECQISDTEEEDDAPRHYRISWRPSWGSEDTPDEELDLFRFFCYRGAYNEVHAYLVRSDLTGSIVPLAFATPELEITYEDDDSEKPATDIRIVGYQAENMLVNSDYDPDSMTITSHSKWRGLGDAFSSGTWLFRQGKFTLVKYEVDPSYDGEINPVTVLDYDTAP